MEQTKLLPNPELEVLPGGIASIVGDTPLLSLNRLLPKDLPGVELHAKAEWFNPGGSVKDRPARSIIRKALEAGEFEGGRRLLDSTSGNMGIAYATIGAALGIAITLVIPSNASLERFAILRALGAEIVLSDPLEGSDGAMLLARQMAAEQPGRYYYADQYNNPANWQAHYRTTGPEIWRQTGGRVTHFVAGLGTSGTITGVGTYLREQNPDIQIVAFQPDGPFHGLEGLKHMPSSHRPGIFNPDFPDRILEISTEKAYGMTRRLARQLGVFVGPSSGAAAVAALQLAAELSDAYVVTVFPDGGVKYLSEAFWEAGA